MSDATDPAATTSEVAAPEATPPVTEVAAPATPTPAEPIDPQTVAAVESSGDLTADDDDTAELKPAAPSLDAAGTEDDDDRSGWSAGSDDDDE